MSEDIQSIHFLVVVYGNDYLDAFLKITFRNLRYLIKEIDPAIRTKSTLRIYTDSNGYTRLHEVFSRIDPDEFLKTEIVDYLSSLNDDMPYGGYSHMVRCQEHAVKHAWTSNSVLFFIGPDQIYPKGAFSEFINIIKSGKRIIVGFAPRILKLPATKFIIDHINSVDDCFALDRVDQIELFRRYTHPVNNQFVLGEQFSLREKAYIYQISDQQLSFRSFQGPTLVAWPKRKTDDFTGFIDHHLVEYCISNINEYHLLGDSDKILPLDLTDDRRIDGLGSSFSKVWQIDLLNFLIDKRQLVNLHQILFSLNYSSYTISPDNSVGGVNNDYLIYQSENINVECIIMIASIILNYRANKMPFVSIVIEIILKHNLLLLLHFKKFIHSLSKPSLDWLRLEVESFENKIGCVMRAGD